VKTLSITKDSKCFFQTIIINLSNFFFIFVVTNIFDMPHSPVSITVTSSINAPISRVWESWTQPHHVKNWNHATEDWYCPEAENDLRIGGKFTYTMAAKDGSFSFDFWGVYTDIAEHQRIVIKLGDDRNMEVHFLSEGDARTKVTEIFDAETENPVDMQQMGWQMILDNFKNYTEKL
jgi:uncharacterized protein YndB with AHSA1/START domain